MGQELSRFTAADVATATARTRRQAEIRPRTESPDEAIRRDAEMYATAQVVSVEEAIRRLQFQNATPDLEPQLRAHEPEVFAELWLQHQPTYPSIVALPAGGKEQVLPYINDPASAAIVGVRPAR